MFLNDDLMKNLKERFDQSLVNASPVINAVQNEVKQVTNSCLTSFNSSKFKSTALANVLDVRLKALLLRSYFSSKTSNIEIFKEKFYGVAFRTICPLIEYLITAEKALVSHIVLMNRSNSNNAPDKTDSKSPTPSSSSGASSDDDDHCPKPSPGSSGSKSPDSGHETEKTTPPSTEEKRRGSTSSDEQRRSSLSSGGDDPAYLEEELPVFVEDPLWAPLPDAVEEGYQEEIAEHKRVQDYYWYPHREPKPEELKEQAKTKYFPKVFYEEVTTYEPVAGPSTMPQTRPKPKSPAKPKFRIYEEPYAMPLSPEIPTPAIIRAPEYTRENYEIDSDISSVHSSQVSLMSLLPSDYFDTTPEQSPSSSPVAGSSQAVQYVAPGTPPAQYVAGPSQSAECEISSPPGSGRKTVIKRKLEFIAEDGSSTAHVTQEFEAPPPGAGEAVGVSPPRIQRTPPRVSPREAYVSPSYSRDAMANMTCPQIQTPAEMCPATPRTPPMPPSPPTPTPGYSESPAPIMRRYVYTPYSSARRQLDLSDDNERSALNGSPRVQQTRHVITTCEDGETCVEEIHETSIRRRVVPNPALSQLRSGAIPRTSTPVSDGEGPVGSSGVFGTPMASESGTSRRDYTYCPPSPISDSQPGMNRDHNLSFSSDHPNVNQGCPPMNETYCVRPATSRTRVPMDETYCIPNPRNRRPPAMDTTYTVPITKGRQPTMDETFVIPIRGRRPAMDETYTISARNEQPAMNETYCIPPRRNQPAMNETYIIPGEAEACANPSDPQDPDACENIASGVSNDNNPETNDPCAKHKKKKTPMNNFNLQFLVFILQGAILPKSNCIVAIFLNSFLIYFNLYSKFKVFQNIFEIKTYNTASFIFPHLNLLSYYKIKCKNQLSKCKLLLNDFKSVNLLF